MLLTNHEHEHLIGALWVDSQRYSEAFGHDSTMARFFMRVVRALERGEVVQRGGGWVRRVECQREDG